MMEYLQAFLPSMGTVMDFLYPYKDAVLLFVAIYIWSSFQTWRKRFYGNIHVDVTYLQPAENGKFKLRIRTIVDDTPVADIFTNMKLRWAYLIASRYTVEDDPIIRLKNKDLQWLMLNRFVNLVSAEFGEHFLRAAMGQDVRSGRFWLVPTFEPGNMLAVRKSRVMLISKDLLANPPAMDKLEFEKSYHETRLETLQSLYYESFKEIPDMATVEIAVD